MLEKKDIWTCWSRILSQLKCSGDTAQTRAAALPLPLPALPLTQGIDYLEDKFGRKHTKKYTPPIGFQKEEPLSTGDLFIFVINTM